MEMLVFPKKTNRIRFWYYICSLFLRKITIFASKQIMIMTIPHAEHIVYPTTFLQNAVVGMSYNDVSQSSIPNEILFNGMKRFFKDNFGLEFNIDSVERLFNLSSNDIDMSYTFTPNSSLVRVGRKDYTSFDASMMPNFYRLKNYVYKVLNNQSITQLWVRKVNMFPVTVVSPADDELYQSLKKFMLSEEMTSQTMVVDSDIIISGAKSDIEKCELVDGNERFVVRTGMTKKEGETNVYNLALDITCHSKDEEFIKEDGVEERLLELNQRLFDLFQWSVSGEVKDVMNSGQ